MGQAADGDLWRWFPDVWTADARGPFSRLSFHRGYELGGKGVPVPRAKEGSFPSRLDQPTQTADFAVSFQIVPRLRSNWITTEESGLHVR